MANNSISLVSLDFDTLKTQLKSYLKGQAQFSDYDFDGSNMSVLLDILTYNTHLNAFYLNMVASESFIDSAQLRSSVLSHAKALNYTPRSAVSSRATINLRFDQSGLSSFAIPENTRFTGKNSRGTFQFLTGESMVLYPSNNAFTANGVVIYQGAIVSDAFVTNYAIENQRFILSNEGIDTDSLLVTVIEDGQNTVFSKATTLFNVEATSNVYFLQAADTKYEIVFGDGTFGRRPKDGSVITARYRNTSGSDGNETTSFVLNDNLGALNGHGSSITPTIVTVTAGIGGANSESIEEIRYRAPRYYQAQERAVTTNDFATLITQQFQTIKNVYVYGGELATGTPQYGKVFISPVTFTGELLSFNEKGSIESFLSDKTTIGITPVVIDPDYLYIGVECEVVFDSGMTTLSAADIQSKVKDAIAAYNSASLMDFNSEFKTSRFETQIDAADPSISSNDTDITMRKRFTSAEGSTAFPTVSYKNAVVPGTITSSSFTSGGRSYQYTDYNPYNNTFVVTQVDGRAVITNTTDTMYLMDVTSPSAISYSPAGTVNYESGTVTLNSIRITTFSSRAGLDFYAKPVSENVVSRDNDVISIDPDNIVVTMRQI